MGDKAAAVPTINPTLSSTPATTLTGWSWGAFILGPFYFIAVKKYWYLLLYLLYFIPLLNFLGFLGISIFLGVKGRKMAYESSMFASDTEATGFLQATDHAGKVIFIVSILFFVGFVALWLSLFSFFAHSGLKIPAVTPTPTLMLK